ncbi:MAG: heme-binding domain-containing protein, partial [Bacteroidetes bacterium]|nr:heme-binding domain-containing protein [Bacteroidota bacterium]
MKAARNIWKKARILLFVVIIIGVVIQFIRPDLDNPPVTGDLKAPAEVSAILRRACYDCHSNETHLAWFDLPAPAYWLVADHVKKGRKVLNFSNWDSLPAWVQTGKLYESVNQIEHGVMPIAQYTTFHHNAKITPEEIAVLKRYLLTIAPAMVPDTAKSRASLEQYENWIISATAGGVKDE